MSVCKIDSALIAYRPQLRPFFYSRWAKFLVDKFLSFLMRKRYPGPIVSLQTKFGHSGLIMLPHSLAEIKLMKQERKEEEVLAALRVALAHGAKRVSLAGQLASQLNYCQEFASRELLVHQEKLTTGHAMTCLAVASTFETILDNTRCRTLAIIGVGSIGQSSLMLLLEKIPGDPITEIILCDLKEKEQKVRLFSRLLQERYGLKSSIVFHNHDGFEEIYRADMFLGASSSSNVLDAGKLLPGSVLVDDSFPPVISVRKSIDRMKKKGDILIVGGGKLLSAPPQLRSLTWKIPQFLINTLLRHLGRDGLPGCWLEAVVFAHQGEAATHGTVTPQKALSLWNLKERLELTSSKLHFYSYIVPKSLQERVYRLRRDGT